MWIYIDRETVQEYYCLEKAVCLQVTPETL